MKQHETSEALKTTLRELRTTRDEVKLKLHLLSMEARDKWHELESKLESLEHKVDPGGEKAAEVLGKARELRRSAKEFIERHLG